MKTEFVVGNSYSREDIEENGFINTKTTSVIMFYRKENILMCFNIPKPLEPKLYKLISISED
ncbi:MAG: hypothetical protein WCL51_06360 [Bacteroidota bacterium]